MAKEFTVEYGNNKYTRNALTGEALTTLALVFQLKFACFTSTGFDIMTFRDTDSFGRHQCIKDIFAVDEWKWLINEIIYNDSYPIAVNGKFLDRAETEEHFAGDVLKLMTVTYKMAVENMGERSAFMASLNGFTKNIAGSLSELVKTYSEDVAQSVNLFAKAQNSKKQNTKRKSK